MNKIFITLLFLIIGANALGEDKAYITLATQKKLWEKKQWQRLLHYKRDLIFFSQAQADGKKFFLSKNGKSDPKAELLATIKAQLDPTIKDDDEHPICRFPARFIWLNRELGIAKDAPRVTCKKFTQFIIDHRAQSASLVFSSFHLDSPASAYGHTLLRLNKLKHPVTGKHHELLDFGINYAANATTTNPLLYAFLGLVGGFKGTFTSIPYYYKIREYNDYESRDLWSYNLNMTPEELQMLMAHIWELGGTYFDYYYLSENCSYHILGLLEAVNPDWNLLETLPPWVVPSETIKSLYNVPGLVESIDYRPSLREQLRFTSSQLTREQLQMVSDLDHSRSFDHFKMDDKKNATKTLDVLIDYLDFRYADDILKEQGKNYRWKNAVLEKRSLLHEAGVNRKIAAPMDNAPHLSHSQHRIGTSVGDNDEGTFQTFSFRFTYHDLLDPRIGMPYLSRIEMGNFNFRYRYDQRELVFDEFVLAYAESLNPWSFFSKKLSFHARFGAKNYNFNQCHDCFAPSTSLGTGASFEYSGKINVITTLYLDAELAYHKDFHRSGMYVAAGPKYRSIFWWSDLFVTEIGGHIYQAPTMKNDYFWEYGQESRYHFKKDFSALLSVKNINNEIEGRVGVNVYF